MSLRIGGSSKLISRFLSVVCVIVLASIFCLLVYNEKKLDRNKPPRSESTQSVIPEEVELDETPVTKKQKDDYKVSPDKPRYITIDKIKVVNARVFEVGTDSQGRVDVPINIFDTAWYRESNLPGQSGAMLLNGHNGGPTEDGVFKNLDKLGKGDELVVERGDGKMFYFSVAEVKILTIKDSNAYMSSMMVSIDPSKDGLNLISCTGEWNQNNLTYNKRVLVRAVAIDKL
jgi:Sortase (surface protein transpeptidase)